MKRYWKLLRLTIEMASYILTLRLHLIHKPWEELSFIRAGMTEHLAELEDATVHYWVGGKMEKTSLLLIPPVNHDGKGDFYRNIGPLAREFRVVVPDLVWYGESTSDKEDYTADFQMQVLLQLMERLDIEHFSIVGTCYGALLGYKIAQLKPNRVDKLVVNGYPIVGFTPEEYEQVARRADVTDLMSQLFYPETAEDLRRLINISYYKPPPINDFFLRKAHKKLFGTNKPQRRALIQQAMDSNIRTAGAPHGPEDLVQHKTLLLWGRQDLMWTPDVGERTARALGENAHLQWIDKAGNAVNLEQPREFNRAVLEFLRQDTRLPARGEPS